MNPQALDQAKVAELEELQEGLFERLALLFLQELPADMARLRRALGAGDPAEARAAAHKIKGGAAAVGAAGVSGKAALLERLAGAGDLSSAGQEIVRLEESLEELESTLARAGVVPPAS